MDDEVQSIDIDAVLAGLRQVRAAVPEAAFGPSTVPIVPSFSALDALCKFVDAVDKVRGAMVRESEGLANEVTIIALNTHYADEARIETANATQPGTTTSTSVPTVQPATSVVAPPSATSAADVTPTNTTTTSTTTTTTVPSPTAEISPTTGETTTPGNPDQPPTSVGH